MIITGGENVSSIEVEDCLYQHPAVAEAAVIGVPDEQVGRDGQGARRPARRASAVDEADLIAFCRERLAALQVPDVASSSATTLPRTATGKLQKFKLREPYWIERAPLGGR